jgi:hypothetical protein
MMIQRLNPLRILELDDNKNHSNVDFRSEAVVKLVSETPGVAFSSWEWGEPRGGTNAITVNDTFLSFFHSRGRLHGNDLTTYFFGAISFTAHPPFRLLKISNAPIIDERFYSGPWIGPHNCYTLFPSSLFLHGKDELKITMGYNDVDGYLLTISLERLLETMVPVG